MRLHHLTFFVLIILLGLAGCGSSSAPSESDPAGSTPSTIPAASSEGLSYTVSAWFPDYDLIRAADTFSAHRNQIDEINPVWFLLRGDYTIESLPQANDAVMTNIARGAGIKIVPTIMNSGNRLFDPVPLVQILSDSTLRAAHVNALAQLVHDGGYDGIELDYENLPASVASEFTALVSELRRALPGKVLSIAVHAKTSDGQNWQGPGSQRWNELLPLVDHMKIMIYDYHWSTGLPGAIAPLSWTRQVLDYAESVAASVNVSPRRIMVGMPLYGWDWPGGPPAQEAMYEDMVALKNSGTLSSRSESRDPDSGECIFRYTKNSIDHVAYYQDGNTLAGRFALIRESYPNLGGVAFWRLGGEDPRIWQAVQNYLR